MEAGNAKLFGKMAQVMGTVRTLEKTGRNQFDKYDFLTADAIATRIGTALAAAGIAFLPSLVSLETSEYTTQKGGSNFRTVAHFQMTFACTETGATWSSLWSGEAIDRSDKSISKAATSAVKYFLIKTFLLAGGDEEDADASSPHAEPAQDAQARPQRAQAPAKVQSIATPQNAAPDTTWDVDRDNNLSTVKQTERIHDLGEQYYGLEWDEKRPQLAELFSKGAVKTVKELKYSEAEKLIKGLEKKLAETGVTA